MDFLFGETQDATYQHNANRIFIRQFTCPANDLVCQVHVYSILSGNVKVMVYDDSSNTPGSLLSSNDDGVSCIGGQWNAITLPSFRTYADQKYWIGAITDTDQALGRAGTSGVTEYLDTTYGTWTAPSTWPGGTPNTYESCYSAYGSVISVDYGLNVPQQGDVWHFDDTDGGNIEVANGFVTMTKFIESAVYLCWFGGNEDDDGSQATALKQWWGNEGETKERQHRGKLQSLLDGRPITSALLPQIEKAATDDVKNGMPKEVLGSVSVSASAPSPKRINLRADVMTKWGTPYIVNIGVEL